MTSMVETRLQDCPFSPPAWTPTGFDSDGRLRRLEEFVRSNLGRPISLALAAREACLARCYFSTFFRRRLGIGFHQWLTCLRVHRATRELAETQKTITEIAWGVGFRDMTTFTRAFRRVTGTTPSRFRVAAVGRVSYRRPSIDSGGERISTRERRKRLAPSPSAPGAQPISA